MKVLVPKIIFGLIIGLVLSVSNTKSLLSDTEKTAGNILSVSSTYSDTAPTPTTAPTKVVINEVYYDVGPNKGSETNPANDEWVELYNNTDQPINLKNWTITDNSSSRTIHANVGIPAHEFALLAKDANTWTYWSVPSGVEKISLGQEIGNGLANTGDRLTLKDDTGTTIDQMSYGSDTTFFSLTPVHDGHSWERNPDGLDTNGATDFIDQINPAPGI